MSQSPRIGRYQPVEGDEVGLVVRGCCGVPVTRPRDRSSGPDGCARFVIAPCGGFSSWHDRMITRICQINQRLSGLLRAWLAARLGAREQRTNWEAGHLWGKAGGQPAAAGETQRSEERRVGKECRSRGWRKQ